MNVSIKTLSVTILLFYLTSFNLISQNQKLNFEDFTIEDGLASVNAILKDKNGFMWFGGTHGLYRYDGFNFKIFTADDKNSSSLSNNNITYLFEDKEGFIWVGTRQGGLNKFNPINESFDNYKNTNKNPIYVKSFITTITEDKDGFIWVGTSGDGIFFLNKKTGFVKQFMHHESNLNTISNNHIFSIKAQNDNIWITSNKGILDCYNKTTNLFSHFIYSNKKYLSTRTGQRLCIDYKKNIWIGTEDEGVFKFEITTKTFKHFKHIKGRQSLSSNVITDLKEGKPNELWLTTDGGGLNLLNTETENFTVYKNDIYDKNSLTNNSSYCLFIDLDYSVWVGMGDGTVNKTTHSPFKIYEFSTSNLPNTLSFNVVVSLSMKDTLLWIGTGGGGLDSFNPQTETFSNYKHNPDDDTSLPSNIVMTILEDTKGDIWTGSFKKGIKFKKKLSNIFETPKFNNDDAPNLKNNLVFDLEKDEKNNIWIATYDEGLYYYDVNNKKIKHFTTSKNKTRGLKSNTILSLLVDSSKRLWLGSIDSGIQIYSSEKNKFYTLKDLGFNETIAKNNPIKDIFEDTQC